MSAHSAAHRGGWLTALVAQVSDYVFEEVDDPVEPQPQQLERHPVVAVVAAAPRSGTTTLARLLAAEMAVRQGGAAAVIGASARRRTAPPSRAAVRLATALAGVGHAHPVGRLCLLISAAETAARPLPDSAYGLGVAGAARESGPRVAADTRIQPTGIAIEPSLQRDDPLAASVNAARYLAPVILDLPADGSGAGVTAIADRVVVVAAASNEPALLDAVAAVVGGNPIKVVNRAAEAGLWANRVDVVIPESRIGARAAVVGTRALGSLGSAICGLADVLEARQ